MPTLFGNLFLFDERVVMMAIDIVVIKKKEKNEALIGCQPLRKKTAKPSVWKTIDS